MLFTQQIAFNFDDFAFKGNERLSEWQEARQLVGGHPEMRGVDLERDDLIYFKAHDAIREAVLCNDEAGSNDPFLGDLFLLDEDCF